MSFREIVRENIRPMSVVDCRSRIPAPDLPGCHFTLQGIDGELMDVVLDPSSMIVIGALAEACGYLPPYMHLPSIMRDMRGFESWDAYLEDRMPKVDARPRITLEPVSRDCSTA